MIPKSLAASRVNDKMKRGMDLLRKADPQAVLKTERYYTYPVYPDPVPARTNGSATVQAAARVPVAWRAGLDHYPIRSDPGNRA